MKNSMSLIFLLGLLALSPWKEGLAQTGSEEGSTDSAGMTGTESGTRSRENTESPGTTGTESNIQNRGDTGSSGTTDIESGTRSRENTEGMGTEGRSGSGTRRISR